MADYIEVVENSITIVFGACHFIPKFVIQYITNCVFSLPACIQVRNRMDHRIYLGGGQSVKLL